MPTTTRCGCSSIAAGRTDPEHLRVGRAIAITGADVLTLRSMQLKGRALSGSSRPTPRTEPEPAGTRLAFFTDIAETDGTPLGLLMERLVPDRDIVRAQSSVEELYDQTPGPARGPSRRWAR